VAGKVSSFAWMSVMSADKCFESLARCDGPGTEKEMSGCPANVSSLRSASKMGYGASGSAILGSMSCRSVVLVGR